MWGRQTGQAKRKAQHVQEGGRSPQRGGVSGLLANGMAHGRGRLRVTVLVGGGGRLHLRPLWLWGHRVAG